MDIEERMGLRSSFNIVPELYNVSAELRQEMVERGFEVGVHGLHHDGHLFRSRRIFEASCPKINGYLKNWNAVGFRAPSMLRNLKWIGEFDIEYDASTFDTDPFEPQSEGVGTIFPFIVDSHSNRKPYIELPYTLPQDSTLFIILGETSPRIWKEKLAWIAGKGGMALINTHPDYMHMDGDTETGITYPVEHYREFLEFVAGKYGGQFWHGLPREISRWVSATPGIVNTKTLRRSCMVAYSFYDSDNRVRRYAETLARRGDDVEALGLRHPDQPVEGLLSGVKVSRIQSRKRDERGPLAYLLRILRFWITSSAILAWRHWRRPYALIHVHSVPDFEVFAGWFPKLLGAKVILDIHDPVPDFFAAKFSVDDHALCIRLLKLLERRSTHFADHVITVTHYWRDRIAERCRLPSDKCSVILNYPDTRLFRVDGEPDKRVQNDQGFRLIYPGSLNPHCGISVLLKAIRIARESIPNIAIDIYGSGQDLPQLKVLMDQLELHNAVAFHEPVPLHAVPKLMGHADLGVALLSGGNRYARQALNVKLFEFLAVGLPAIATRTESTQYYLNDSIVSFSTMDDPQDVARCIVELYNSPERRAQQVRNGLAYVKTHNWEVQMHGYLSTVDSLVVPEEVRPIPAKSVGCQ
jgi:glycosyltransferase involved in cell wall biosynthesis/peptidoglycan/xylan/chitin deacetylase (PgdA/CDA1 family)